MTPHKEGAQRTGGDNVRTCVLPGKQGCCLAVLLCLTALVDCCCRCNLYNHPSLLSLSVVFDSSVPLINSLIITPV